MTGDTTGSTLEQPLGGVNRAWVSKVLLGMVVLFHGVLLLFISIASPRGLYNSPDEQANVFFAEGIKRDGYLTRPVVRLGLPSSVTPRSMLRSDDTYIPVGFVSMPVVLGLIGKLIGMRGVPYVVALISAGALLAWYGFLRRLFGNRIALLSAFLAAGSPLIMYWGERPWYPNSLFLALTLYALYGLSGLGRLREPHLSSAEILMEQPTLEQRRIKRTIGAVVSGFLIGLALTLRPEESMWLIPGALFILWNGTKRMRFSRILCLMSAAIPLVALLALQKLVYGSPLRTGYHLTSLPTGAVRFVTRLMLPFGIHLDRIAPVVFYYGLGLTWWLIALAIAGGIGVFLRKEGRTLKRLRAWSVATVLLLVWLLTYYGSFQITDRFDHAASLGTSFSRYFLPFYVMITPLVAYALFMLRRRWGGRGFLLLLIPCITVLSLRLVFWSRDESLTAIVSALKENRVLHDRIVAVVPEESIILTDRLDKALFPAREVVTRFRQFSRSDFVELYPYRLYYDTIADPEVVEFENAKFWGPHGLKAVDPVELGYRHVLYRLLMLKPIE